MGHYHDVAGDLREPTRDLREPSPTPGPGSRTSTSRPWPTVRCPTRIKELMALVVGVVEHCDGCVAYHARAAAAAGATEGEVAEALGVALLMDGGPASVWAPVPSPRTASSPNRPADS